MTNDPRDIEPTRRQWVGFWSMIVQQTQNAFNDKAAQFILIPLGGAVGYSVESAAGLMIALPFVLFAPLAGWMSDRFSKRHVMIGAACVQVAVLVMICAAVMMRDMPLALVGFFMLAVQSAFFSPAKIGINKELVGSRHLGFAAGVQQMMAMLAILAGQIAAGRWFDSRYADLGAIADLAWKAALFPLLLLTAISIPSVLLAVAIPKVPAQGGERLTGKVLISHFRDLKELWRDLGLRRASLGVAFFWGFAAFINLWSVKVAKSLTDGGKGFGTLSADFMAAASLGMVLGFGTASLLLRKRIELGWVPLAGVAMTLNALALALVKPGGWWFLVALGSIAFFSALFLAPLNAWMQDRYPPAKRGELQSAVNLQDCFAGIIAVVMIEGLIRLALMAGFGELVGFRMQMLVLGGICGLMTFYIMRLLPADLIRLVCLGLVRSFYRIKVANRDRLPLDGGVLIVPNHVTFADAFFISAACHRPVRFVMDETFMANRAVRLSARLFETVPIRRDQPLEAIRIIIAALEKGDAVCLFPEGQLTRTGGLCELERGFELITRKSRSVILPLWCDGGWGSVFSFERRRFFWKRPYRIPYGLTLAFGEMIDAKDATRGRVRAALERASAKAVSRRFWPAFPRLPERDARINGYQLTQLDVLKRRSVVYVLERDERVGDILPSLREFARQGGGRVVVVKVFAAQHGRVWLGGERLRKELELADLAGDEVNFHDFSGSAADPLDKAGVSHFPALAINGRIISMSMEHPPKPKEDSDFQAGQKAGSFGKLLPGWWLDEQTGSFHGPASSCGLGDGYEVDGGGFVSGGAVRSASE